MRHTLLTLEDHAPGAFERVDQILPSHLLGGTFALWSQDGAAGEAAILPFEGRLPILLVVPVREKGGVVHLAFNTYRLNLPTSMRDEAVACTASILDLMRTATDALEREQSLAVDLAHAAEERRRLAQDLTTTHSQLLLALTEREKIECALRESEERYRMTTRMQHTQRLESLGVLAGAIAHDFNNLLTAILGNVDMATADMPPTAPSRPHLQEIARAAHQAAELCFQLMAYAGNGHLTIQKLDLGHLVQEMVYILEVSISKKAVLRYNLAPHLPQVEADAAQMRQVILNLVMNASEAVAEHSGYVSVSTGVTSCDSTYLADCLLGDMCQAGDYVCLEVVDNGNGMDPATLSRIFEPFFSARPTSRGLGLSAVLGIVRGHHGAIHVSSAPGQGSTFKVLLPALTSSTVATEKEETPEEILPSWRGSGTVLVIDDEESVRTIARQMLERMGFRVLLASDGREGVVIFRETEASGVRITCVLLDLTMPHMDGEEAFHELRRLRPDVTVVLASGYSEATLFGRFANLGFSGFLQKPYRLATLQHKIAGLLEGDKTV